MYKLLATDIDGTLINSKRELTDNTKKAIYEAYDKGCVILPCSGRGPLPLQDITNEIDLDLPLACFNGALVIKGKSGEILYEKAIDKEDAILAYNEGVKRNVGVIAWTFDNKLAFNEFNKFTEHYLSMANVAREDVIIIPEHMEIFDERITKVLWQDEVENMDDHVAYARNLLKTVDNNAMCATSQPFLLEFTHKDANKAEAIKHVAKAFDIEHKDTIGIGDGLNDIPMIEYAALGVAMKNSHKETLEAADYIAPSNDEDGVAYVINKFMLGKE